MTSLVEGGYPAAALAYYRGGMHDWVSLAMPNPAGRGRVASSVSEDRKPQTQRNHWEQAFAAHPMMYGELASAPAQHAIGLFRADRAQHVLELGAGQGRDSLALLDAGFTVTALDYAESALRELRVRAERAGSAGRLRLAQHDVRLRLPLPDSSVDAVFSHMLFCMALTTAELVTLSAEVARVLRPGGLHVYTVRHIGDAHYEQGMAHGDDRYESGGFIVHFFDRALVDKLAVGFDVLDVEDFEEGELPRRLWRITERRGSSERPDR